jgi:lysophospholipase L1-like esterase
VLTVLASAELAARVDDRLRYGIPLGAAPDQAYDLRLHDTLGVRGRPHGRFRWWQLNAFGFRGPEMAVHPDSTCPRVVVLGSSEAFGYYESPGHEFPAQLRDRLQGRRPCREVVNAAIAGASLHSMRRLWTQWVARFAPRYVIVYANPAFYLSTVAPAATTLVRADSRSGDRPRPWWTPRLLDRAHQALHYPAVIQRRRVASLLDEEVAGHDTTWFFTTVPADRLAQYAADLDSLTASICAAGAAPVLVTHAVPFGALPAPGDSDLLREWRTYNPRATTGTLLAFNDSAAAVTGRVAARYGTLLVDAAGRLGGRPHYFVDFTHFTDDGAAAMASLLDAALRGDSLSRPPCARR